MIWGIKTSANWILFRWNGLPNQSWVGNIFEEKLAPKNWFLKYFLATPLFIIFGYGVLNALNMNLIHSSLIVIQASDPIVWSFKDSVSLGIVIFGLYISIVSDNEINNYRQNYGRNSFCTCGLRRIFKNPKNLGELAFWWGFYFLSLNSDQFDNLFVHIQNAIPFGPVLLTIFVAFNSYFTQQYRKTHFVDYE